MTMFLYLYCRTKNMLEAHYLVSLQFFSEIKKVFSGAGFSSRNISVPFSSVSLFWDISSQLTVESRS